MTGLTQTYYLVFGLLTAFGGWMGYRKAGSAPSLYAGLACGALLCAASFVLGSNLNTGLIMGLVASIAMLGFFGPKLLQGALKPHVILSALLAAVGLALTLITWTRR